MIDRATAEKRYAHGTRARYAFAKCRCFDCKVANTDYEFLRNAARRNPWCIHFAPEVKHYVVRHRQTGEIKLRIRDRNEARKQCAVLNARVSRGKRRPNELVSTTKVRKHVAWLKSQGVGVKAIARSARVNRGVLVRIMQGEIRKTRRSTADKILAVTPRTVEPTAQAKVDARPTWELLDRLISWGFRKGWIAQQLGYRTPALQMRKDRILLTSAAKVRSLYDDILAEKARRVEREQLQAPLTDHQRALARIAAMDDDSFSRGFARLMREVPSGQM